MTTKTVITLTEAQLRFLQGSVGIALTVIGEAGSTTMFRDDAWACRTMIRDAGDSLTGLDHQEAQELLELLELAESVELSATDTTADDADDDEPMGFEAAFVEAAASAHCRE